MALLRRVIWAFAKRVGRQYTVDPLLFNGHVYTHTHKCAYVCTHTHKHTQPITQYAFLVYEMCNAIAMHPVLYCLHIRAYTQSSLCNMSSFFRWSLWLCAKGAKKSRTWTSESYRSGAVWYFSRNAQVLQDCISIIITLTAYSGCAIVLVIVREWGHCDTKSYVASRADCCQCNNRVRANRGGESHRGAARGWRTRDARDLRKSQFPHGRVWIHLEVLGFWGKASFVDLELFQSLSKVWNEEFCFSCSSLRCDIREESIWAVNSVGSTHQVEWSSLCFCWAKVK